MTETEPRCAICWAPHWHVERTQPTGLQRMHVIPRSKRRCDEDYNTLFGCWRCHGNQHCPNAPGWQSLTLPMLLHVKRASGEWRPHELEHLYCRRLPDLEPLPEEYLRERRRFTPYELPMPKTLHSDEAERLMLDPYWQPTWTLDKVIEPDGRVWWQVRDGVLVTAKEWGRGTSDVEAIREAIEKNRRRKPTNGALPND